MIIDKHTLLISSLLCLLLLLSFDGRAQNVSIILTDTSVSINKQVICGKHYNSIPFNVINTSKDVKMILKNEKYTVRRDRVFKTKNYYYTELGLEFVFHFNLGYEHLGIIFNTYVGELPPGIAKKMKPFQGELILFDQPITGASTLGEVKAKLKRDWKPVGASLSTIHISCNGFECTLCFSGDEPSALLNFITID